MESKAQFGEDLIVLDYFGHEENLIFVEVGAFLPDALSQTWLLEQHGWEGVLVEPQPDLCELLRSLRRARVFQVACGNPEQGGSEILLELNGALSRLVGAGKDTDSIGKRRIYVPVRTLDSILEDASISKIDFLSIDTEGFELNVLQGFSFAKYCPRLIIIEDHGEAPNTHRYLRLHGYRLVKRTGCNDWYVPSSAKFPISVLESMRLKARICRSLFRNFILGNSKRPVD